MAQVWIWNSFGTQMVRADAIIKIASTVSGTDIQVNVETAEGSTLVWTRTNVMEAGADFDYEAMLAAAKTTAVQFAHAILEAQTKDQALYVLDFMAEEKVQAG